MKQRKLYNIFLALALFVTFYASGIGYIPLNLHTCCAYEPYCAPCLYLDKLRDTLRLGGISVIAVKLILPVLFELVAILGLCSHSATNLVELKVRMNN